MIFRIRYAVSAVAVLAYRESITVSRSAAVILILRKTAARMNFNVISVLLFVGAFIARMVIWIKFSVRPTALGAYRKLCTRSRGYVGMLHDLFRRAAAGVNYKMADLEVIKIGINESFRSNMSFGRILTVAKAADIADRKALTG